MKKNVKILGAAAAALLAVAPVVASATTVNASTTNVSAGATTTNPDRPALNINVSLNATAGQTTAAQAAQSVKLTVDNGAQVDNFSQANVHIYDTATREFVPAGQTLQAGHKYRVAVTGIHFSNLLTGKTWNLGDAWFNGKQTATSEELMSNSEHAFLSAPFYLTEAGNTTQPYFFNWIVGKDGVTAGNQLANGDVAHVGTNGEGVDHFTDFTAQGILTAAKGNVGLTNGEITTTASDVASQLAQQNVALKDGKYVLPTNGFHVTLTAVNRMSNRTVTVVVPFAGSRNNYAGYPTISVKNDAVSDTTVFSDDFQSASSKGVQNHPASDLVRKVKVNSDFDNNTALAPFKAVTGNGASQVDLAVLSNPVNTRVPGRYTVTVQATDWSTGKTSRLSYTVQVGDSDATYQTVNYPAEYGVNVWSIAGNTVSFTGNRQAGQSSVATFDTKTVNGVEYTRIESATSNKWIQSQYLGNHKPANSETKLNGTGRVSYNGKGSVRLLNANGHYVDQYVKKGSSFKVWAEKTVNGQHLYRIGSQSQWIPAKYFSLN